MIFKVIGPLSRLYLAKKEDREGCNTHDKNSFIFTVVFQLFYLLFVFVCPYRSGELPYSYFSFLLLGPIDVKIV